MKPLPHFLAILAAAAVSFSAQAQTTSSPSEPVSTGKVIATNAQTGVMTMMSAQTRAPLSFYGMNEAKIETNSGKIVGLAEIRPDMAVTVHYAERQGKWYVSRIAIPDATPAPAIPAVTVDQRRALSSPAARDGDITTQPGSKAAIDNDITTQPGSKAAIDNDITTQPGTKAKMDNDITTQPGKKAANDPDITKKTDAR